MFYSQPPSSEQLPCKYCSFVQMNIWKLTENIRKKKHETKVSEDRTTVRGATQKLVEFKQHVQTGFLSLDVASSTRCDQKVSGLVV